MQAVESGMIEMVGQCPLTIQELLSVTDVSPDEGRRFVEFLVASGIFEQYEGLLYLSGFSRKYLLNGSPASQLNVLAFEKLLVEKWNGLGSVLKHGQLSAVTEQSTEVCRERLALFQKAMHEAAAVRAVELWNSLPELPGSGLIIDIGAGDGTYLREFLRHNPGWKAVACDLHDVLELNRASFDNAGIAHRACNIADMDELGEFIDEYAGSCSLLLLSNLIHCYSLAESGALISSLGRLFAEDGLMVIHDFFRDGNSFGALYDIHMLVNTYNGRSYSFDEASHMLQVAGFSHSTIIQLPSLSHAVIASRQAPLDGRSDPLFRLRREALGLGFFEAVPFDPAAITTEPWVKAKCRYGCPCYGRKWSCPPHCMDSAEFSELLAGYTKALLVVGQAPLKDFQERLLELEKRAFLNGHKKALVFTGGPCCWCDECPEDRCIFPEKRRPSLESCGCDVFALAESAGIKVAPLRSSDDFVQFIGLLLVE
jgi:predicted metal-binding protein